MQFSSPMKCKFPAIFLAFATLGSSLTMIESANAADMTPSTVMVNPASNNIGVCGNQHVLSRVSYKFYHEVRHVPDLPRVRIKGWANIAMTRQEPAATKLNVAREFCTATAVMNDGVAYPVSYRVEFGQGLVGVGGFNVEFCVQGFDRWRIQNGDCRAVK